MLYRSGEVEVLPNHLLERSQMRIHPDGSFFPGSARYIENACEMLSMCAEDDKIYEKQPPKIYEKQPPKDFDSIWKLMIEHMFKPFFNFLFPCETADYDLSHFEFLDSELGKIYPEKDHTPPRRIVDKLVKIFRKDDPTRFSLFHIEVQGFANRHFPHRMYEYYYRLSAKYDCPIISLAIITGNQKASVPRYLSANCGATIAYHYPVYQIRHQSEEELLKGLNPFSCVVLAAQKALKIPKMTDAEIMDSFESLARVIESRNWPLDPVYHIYGFIDECVSFKDPENYT